MDLHLRLDRAAGSLAAQISSALRGAVRSGRLPAGTRLPPSRELAADLGVSRGRVVEAYEQLVAEGFLISRQGAGTHVATQARRPRTREHSPFPAPQNGKPAVRAGARLRYDLVPGTPDLSAFPRQTWLAALRAVLATLPSEDLGYPDPGGLHVVRTELAGYLGRVRAADTRTGNVVVVGGVAQGLSLTIQTLVATGRRLLAVEDPTGTRIRPLLRANGAEFVPVPVDGEGIDVTALRRTAARAALVTPAHQYPTGVVLSPARRAALVDWAAEVDAIVLEDDYDAEFRYDREPVGCLQGLAASYVVLIGSVSKSLAPGLRLGWVLAPGWLAHAVREAKANADLGSPALGQAALAHLISSGAYDRHLRQARRRYRSRRDALVESITRTLPTAKIHGISAGVHLMVELPAGTDEQAVVARAAEHGLAVEAVAPMRIASDGPPALVLGYARLPEHRLAAAGHLLASLVNSDRSRADAGEAEIS